MGYLTNAAAAVREIGTEQAEAMGKKFGTDWIVQSFAPKVIEVYNQEKLPFNHRMSCL